MVVLKVQSKSVQQPTRTRQKSIVLSICCVIIVENLNTICKSLV